MPDDSVSPTPRSKIRARITAGSSSHQNETFVRLGNSSLRSISGPMAASSSASSSSRSWILIAHWGLPIRTCWKRHSRPPASSVPVPSGLPSGKSGDCNLARPMSTRQVVSPVMVGRISPAAVWIENVSASVQPARRR